MPKKTNTKFITEARAIHGDKYSYSKVFYKNNSSKIIITCFIHGEFLQKPNSHLQGCGCPVCGGTERLNNESFKAKAKLIHNNTYDYSLVNYINNKTKVIIGCNMDHEPFEQTPSAHLSGQGCPKCKNKLLSAMYSGSGGSNYNPDRKLVALNYKVKVSCSSLLNHTLQATGSKKNTKTSKALGYTQNELVGHLSQFPLYDEWANSVGRQSVQIDHIVPIAKWVRYGVTDPSRINALNNLHLISASENMSKKDRSCPVLEFMQGLIYFPEQWIK